MGEGSNAQKHENTHIDWLPRNMNWDCNSLHLVFVIIMIAAGAAERTRCLPWEGSLNVHCGSEVSHFVEICQPRTA